MKITKKKLAIFFNSLAIFSIVICVYTLIHMDRSKYVSSQEGHARGYTQGYTEGYFKGKGEPTPGNSFCPHIDTNGVVRFKK